MTSLFNKLKPYLGEHKGVVSDSEMLLLNRKDYVMNEVAAVEGFLQATGQKITYSYRMLLMLLDSLAGGIRTEKVKILIADESLWMAGFYTWLKVGGNSGENFIIYSPKGLPKKISHSIFMTQMYDEFYANAIKKPGYAFDDINPDGFTFVIGNTKTGEQTMFAADRFKNVERGVFILKDFGRIGGHSEREYLEKNGMFMNVTLEGHGYLLRL